ncbi:MAG: saccharopine dehydrogenase NADP-binding domain-containing protein [Bacteroidetes bacterium]|nr:saccharopine dehydrogenase NADP-binding domain-containing protein [Bacteroidota bacterium]MBP8753151.1 saccharopine dehydrogenase NADP-binding domain-containing protein [Chitinophagales bacterium]MBP9189140.1 saccharopine dehydrogenase NADP-binding domain-containing protein [Chitinophagales bacterium]MBP9549402.1 saccharopine dehydrogenase NADP-binding domain-containing protein [Chitinophagales bacterium]MBP9705495.1 saccharopine dehydrogenase NADP-binding domain-containing protein [Chitinop
MKKVTVLGAGMVGRAMAIDLAKTCEVSSADISDDNLAKLSAFGINTIQCDLSDNEKIKSVIQAADLVIGAVPGFMGFEMFKTVIEAGKNICDISFFNEDPFVLNDLAKKNNVTAIMDVGVAPGMDNIILGYHNKRMQVKNFECYVGGLPAERVWPYEYKAPFSPADVLEEYTRPARFVRDGKLIIKEALTDPELMYFEGVGTLEAFNSDGLRSLVNTMAHIPNLIERTLRYPGHIELMRVMRATGFFSKEEIEVKGKKIAPLDLTSKLLFPKWKLGDEEHEFTVMRIIVEGNENGKDIIYTYNLLDKYDAVTKTSSMARTTGYTCTAAAQLVLNNMFKSKGVFSPEYLGEEEAHFQFILQYLQERNIYYKKTSV